MPHSRRASGSRRPLRNRPENKARSRTPRHIPAAFAGQKDACKNKGPVADIPAGRYRLSCAQPSGAPVRTSPCLPCARPMPMSTPPMRQTPEPCLLRAAHAAPPRTGGTGTACGPRTCGRPRLPEKAPRHARPNGLPSGGAARCRTRPGNAGCGDAPDAQARGRDSGTAHSKVRMRPGAHRSANGGGRAGSPYAFPGRSPEPSPFRSIQFRRKPSFGNGLSYR